MRKTIIKGIRERKYTVVEEKTKKKEVWKEKSIGESIPINISASITFLNKFIEFLMRATISPQRPFFHAASKEMSQSSLR